ncbi:1-acyl-sn-glycerol-3-phosphate acyltransferases/amino acid adenylation domain-containing protein [Oscillospiraceae bacterium]|nr:1-acyl-sn-glycerol-3-phosphate acyltransferases/amino acid adenylation domain-containing protein [Oscillospiraceae bacterium]
MKMRELTPAQRGMAELQGFYRDTAITTLCGVVLFDALLERKAFHEAFLYVLSDNEAFSLVFTQKDRKIYQYVKDMEAEVAFKSFSSIKEARDYCVQDGQIPFEINGERMYRALHFEAEGRTGFLLSASHMITDAWGYTLFARQVYEAYVAISSGEEPERSEGRYTDYITKSEEYMSSSSYEADLEFWKERYGKGIESSTMGRDTGKGASSVRYSKLLSGELSSAINRFVEENRISPATVFESLMLLYLARTNRDSERITIGVPISGRSRAIEKKTAGCFMSTLPLTVEVGRDDTLRSVCDRVYKTHRELYRHRKLPYSDIARVIRDTTGYSGRIYDVMVNCHNSRTMIPAETEWLSNGSSEVPFALIVDDRDDSAYYRLTVEYRTGCFDGEEEIELIVKRLQYILEQLVSSPDLPVRELSLLPEEERKLLEGFNDTSRDLEDIRVEEAFRRYAASHTDDTALVFHGTPYTYGMLDTMSDAMALFLQKAGLRRGDIVPIVSVRDPLLIVAMLAVMKAGGTYMPVSPDYPLQRIGQMVSSVSSKIALTLGFDDDLEAFGVHSYDMRDIDLTPSSEVPSSGSSPADICYMVFTSGSTGKPKATAVTHRNVINYCTRNDLNVAGGIIKDKGTIVSVTNIVFDIFVTESILSLVNGIRIVLADDDEALYGGRLASLIREQGVDILQTTPTKMRSFLIGGNRDLLRGIKTLILGGEELASSLLSDLREITNADIYNIYGPAETTVWSSFKLMGDTDITIGRPIANTGIRILGEDMTPMPVGIEGEIVISGEGVGVGYPGNPELTFERFIEDLPGGRMYRTGDMGYIRPDGDIVFCGRRDNQIKLRGLRIEIGEIECKMTSLDGVDLSAVKCIKDKLETPMLLAYYTSSSVTEKEMRTYLQESLPSYMVPHRIIKIDRMPMTGSGKIDRKALPEVSLDCASDRAVTPPSNDDERILCQVLSSVLKLPFVGIDDDFFELGGDSLSAMEFVSLAGDAGVAVDVRDIYTHRTVRALVSASSSREDQPCTSYPLERTSSDIAFWRRISSLILKTYDVRIEGLENIKEGRKYIFCPNHESMADPLFVWTALSDKIDIKDACTIAAKEFMEDLSARRIFKVTGGIPVDRKGDAAPAIDMAIRALKGDMRYLLIHPEGTRTRTGRMGEFKKGASYIARKTGVEIVPVYIGGAGVIFPVGSRYPRRYDHKNMRKYPLTVKFGSPLSCDGKSDEEITRAIKERITDMM